MVAPLVLAFSVSFVLALASAMNEKTLSAATAKLNPPKRHEASFHIPSKTTCECETSTWRHCCLGESSVIWDLYALTCCHGRHVADKLYPLPQLRHFPPEPSAPVVFLCGDARERHRPSTEWKWVNHFIPTGFTGTQTSNITQYWPSSLKREVLLIITQGSSTAN